MQPFNDEVDKILEQYGLDEPGYAMVASDLADLMDEKATELKRLQNENMCLREDNDKLVARVEQLKRWNADAGEWIAGTIQWIQKDVIPLSIKTRQGLAEIRKQTDISKVQKQELQKQIEHLQSDLNGKNFLLDKALIDNAILVQEITYLKEGKQHEKQPR